MRCRASVVFLTITVALCLPKAAFSNPKYSGPGITPPKVKSHTDPKYPDEARLAGVQGTVWYQLTVDEHGKPREITVLAPVGYGMDESGMAAIASWVFSPALKNGTPVAYITMVEVSFKVQGAAITVSAHPSVVRFYGAVTHLRNGDPANIPKALKDLQDLARANYPPAIAELGRMALVGDHVAPNAPQGLALLQKAVDLKCAPAMFELGRVYAGGEAVQKDAARGIDLIRRAAQLGSAPAQFYLATRYETGVELPQDRDAAKTYFQQCAISGTAMCQFRLGSLLRGSYPVQSWAWLRLAAQQGNEDAGKLAETVGAALDPGQLKDAKKLQQHLTHAR